MKGKIKEIFQTIDLFSFTINFNYEGKKAYNSFFGMALSVLTT